MENIMLDRITPPSSAPLENILFPEVGCIGLSNGIPVFFVEYGTQEILEINMLFPSGKCYESSNGVASFTSGMMQEGTKKRTGLEFARSLDAIGAFIHVDGGYETSSVSLTTLEKHLDPALGLLREMVLEPANLPDELEKMRKRSLQHLEVEGKKTAFVARKEFGKLLFGEDHPYGRSLEKENVNSLELEEINRFYKRNYSLVNAVIVVSGRFDKAKLFTFLESHFGNPALIDRSDKIKNNESSGLMEVQSAEPGLYYFEKEESMQATIRVGHLGFKRNHPDYWKMTLVNTILGGYFGSRLMKNIREDKGYTYGIGSGWLSMKYTGSFIVQTDTGNEYIQPVLDEINKEMNLLISKGVDEEELSLVKNYVLGRTASLRETPSQIAGLIRSAIVNQYGFTNYDEKFDAIMSMTPADVKNLAEQYLRPDQLIRVVCGKM